MYLACLAFFGIKLWGVQFLLLKNSKFATPGRLGNYDEEDEDTRMKYASSQQQLHAGSHLANDIIILLGGAENIVDVDACMTRLRVTVKDSENCCRRNRMESNMEH